MFYERIQRSSEAVDRGAEFAEAAPPLRRRSSGIRDLCSGRRGSLRYQVSLQQQSLQIQHRHRQLAHLRQHEKVVGVDSKSVSTD